MVFSNCRMSAKVGKTLYQRFVGTIVELLPFAPPSGRTDEKPDIPGRKEIAEQDTSFGEESLRPSVGSVGERGYGVPERLDFEVLAIVSRRQ